MSERKADADINRFFAHVGLFQFASSLAGVFFVAFLLHQDLPPAVVFLSIGAMHATRFCLRPLLFIVAGAIGMRGTMMIGAGVSGLQFLALSQVKGLDLWLLGWVVTSALSDVLYWPLFHGFFTRLGNSSRLGRQVGLRQMIYAGANILAPPLGGLMLTLFNPLVAFSVAGIIRIFSTLPLMSIEDHPFAPKANIGILSTGRFGATIYMTDGWVTCTAGFGWAIVIFLGLGGRFDTLGLALAVAGFIGACGGFVIGRIVDLGGGRRAVLAHLAVGVVVPIIQVTAGFDSARIVATMIFGSLVGGLACPTIMTAVYAAGKEAPCILRFQFASEGGWDAGAVMASLTCAAILSLGAPIQAAILLGPPMLFFQARLLIDFYETRERALAVGD